MEQPIRMIRALDVPIDLRTEEALREGMVGVARDANGTAVLDRYEHGAGVRAVVRARAANDRGFGERKGFSSHDILGAGRSKARGTRLDGPARCMDVLTEEKRHSVQSLCGHST